MKKFFGAAGFTVLVTLKFPPVNVLVEMEVQFDNANVTFVLVNTSNCWPVVPFVPPMTSVEPVRLTLVMPGCATGPLDTEAIIVPFTARFVVQVNPGADGRTILLNEPAV